MSILGSLEDVITVTPTLADGIYILQLMSVKRVPSKKDPNRENLVINLKVLNQEVQCRETGEFVANNGGFFVSDTQSLTPTEKWSVNDIKVRVAKFIDCVMGDKEAHKVVDLDNTDLNAMLAHKIVKANIGYQAPSPDGKFSERNVIKGYLMASPDDLDFCIEVR